MNISPVVIDGQSPHFTQTIQNMDEKSQSDHQYSPFISSQPPEPNTQPTGQQQSQSDHQYSPFISPNDQFQQIAQQLYQGNQDRYSFFFQIFVPLPPQQIVQQALQQGECFE
jgi:hypothetical protein